MIPNLSKGTKVLLQLSGGKDSIACMIHLKKHNIEFETIHFIHEYGYNLPTIMAEKACEAFKVRLHVVDVSNEIKSRFLNDFKDRPCRYCKGIMDKITVDFAQANHFQLICVGDTKDDKTLINRLEIIEEGNHDISHYFNQAVSLPDDISIYRPLLEYDSNQTLALVLSYFPWFRRVHDTGDKYFEYSREGCPLQFKDYGVKYSQQLMERLKQLNVLCTEYASLKGIRASIHLPSEFIVTIPKGYENDCRQYLLSHGACLKPLPTNRCQTYHILVDINLNESMCSADVIEMACKRYIERLGIVGDFILRDQIGNLSQDGIRIDVAWVNIDRLFVSFVSNEMLWDQSQIENLCLEIFHTRDFKVLNYQKY